MPATARHFAKKEVDVPGFIASIRKFNTPAVQIVHAPLTGDRRAQLYLGRELGGALNELEKTVKALRTATIRFSPSSDRAQTSAAAKSAAERVGASTSLVLDTTEAMIKKGQLVTPVEFQELMGWATRQAVWKAAQSHRVFYLDYKAQRYFPTFYGAPAYDRKHLEAVTKILGDLPGGSKLQFFLTRKGSLGGITPLQALAEGRFSKVNDIAAAFAEVPMGA
jgi:peptidoglycan hydrolase-like protein with peptidoglycan-binding domain